MSRFFSLKALTIIGLIVFICLFSPSIFAQNDSPGIENVIYLKNGSIIRGTMLELKIDDYVKIEDRSGNIWVFKYSEVSEVKTEPIKPLKFNTTPTSNAPHVLGDHSGIFMGIDFGFNVGASSYSNTFVQGNYASSVLGTFQVSLGYHMKSGLSLAGVSGLESFGIITLPLLMDARYYFLKQTFSPFVYMQGGASIPLDQFDYYDPGFAGGVGLGIRKQVGHTSAISLSAGYRYQRLNYKSNFDPWNQWGQSITSEQLNIFNRLSLRFGIIF